MMKCLSLQAKQVVFFEMFRSLRVRLAGGNANAGSNAGASYSNSNNTSSNANATVSSPQCLYEKRLEEKALPLGRTSRTPVKEVGRSQDSKISEGQSRET